MLYFRDSTLNVRNVYKTTFSLNNQPDIDM